MRRERLQRLAEDGNYAHGVISTNKAQVWGEEGLAVYMFFSYPTMMLPFKFAINDLLNCDKGILFNWLMFC